MSCLHISDHLAILAVFIASLWWPLNQPIVRFCPASGSVSIQDQHSGHL